MHQDLLFMIAHIRAIWTGSGVGIGGKLRELLLVAVVRCTGARCVGLRDCGRDLGLGGL
jgi:hypothetical protein